MAYITIPKDEPSQSNVACRRSAEASRAAAISSKLEDGNTSAAVCILYSNDTPAEFSTANLAKLQEKHRLAHFGEYTIHLRIHHSSENTPSPSGVGFVGGYIKVLLYFT